MALAGRLAGANLARRARSLTKLATKNTRKHKEEQKEEPAAHHGVGSFLCFLVFFVANGKKHPEAGSPRGARALRHFRKVWYVIDPEGPVRPLGIHVANSAGTWLLLAEAGITVAYPTDKPQAIRT